MSDDNFDYEDMLNEDSDDEIESVEIASAGGGGTELAPNANMGMEDVKPVKLGKGKVLFLLIAVIIVVILILVLVTEMGITRNDGSSAQNNNPQNSVQENVSTGSENVGDTGTENSDFSGISGEAGSSSSGNINDGISDGTGLEDGKTALIEGEVVAEKDRETEEKAEFEHLMVEPNLGAEITVSGIVKGKSMYRVGDSYTYGVRLILVTGNDVDLECTYFCPKKTADALEVGDSLNVIYRCDSVGTVCVVSISR